MLLQLLAAILWYAFISTCSGESEIIQDKINWLTKRLYKNYWEKDQKYIFGLKWEYQKGIFESKVHFNFLDHHNKGLAAFFREKEGVPDINMFVTSFALYGLLQAQALGTVRIDEHRFSQSLEAIASFRDKNVPEGIPQYSFWPQVNNNGSYTAYATNLIKTINSLPDTPVFLQKILNAIGLGIFGSAKVIATFFIIPADNDDSSVNMALLGFMKELNSPHYSFWNSLHSRKQDYYDRALKYAYRPFETNLTLNPQADQIDPRTYFVLRDFLHRTKNQSQNPSLILPTTWLLNEAEIVPEKIVMPFSANNVDASVCANFIFGLSSQILQGEVSLQKSPQLAQMILDTTSLLQFTIKQVLAKRPTLILVYYPSKFDFYWFVARTVNLYKRHLEKGETLPEPFPQVKERLERLIKEEGTSQILKQAKKGENTENYWVQFLGNYAGRDRNQDAIFSTSLALNALLDAWTTRQGQKVTYDSETPETVKTAINNGVKFLLSNIKPGMKEVNAFFSGSVKDGMSTYPLFFPANHVYDQGKKLDPTELSIKNATLATVTTVKGLISEEQYNEMLKKKWFGFDVPQEEQSLNKGYGATFPFWSSNSIGEIMSITCLSKYMRAQETENETVKSQIPPSLKKE